MTTDLIYMRVERRVHRAVNALMNSQYWIAERETLKGLLEVGHVHKGMPENGATASDLAKYNASLLSIEREILVRSGKEALSTTYREGKQLATEGLEALLGSQRAAQVMEHAGDCATGARLSAQVIANDAKEVYGEVKAVAATGLGSLGNAIQRMSKRMKTP